MNINAIKRIPLNSSVTVTTDTDEKCAGLLTEIGDDYIVLGDMDFVLETEAIKGIVKLGNQIEASDSSDTTLDQPEATESTDSISESISLADLDRATEKLAEIEHRFKSHIQSIHIELKEPDFIFPKEEFSNGDVSSAASAWVQATNAYNYAKRINELSPREGRILRIVGNLNSLVVEFPNSPALRRHLGYLYSLAEDWNGSLQHYQMCAYHSSAADDWLSVAICALRLDKEMIACYSLGEFFDESSIMESSQAWHTFVPLIEKYDHSAISKMAAKTTRNSETDALLETALYLLKKRRDTMSAPAIIMKWLKGESVESLLSEACGKLDEEPTESYRQFCTEFTNEIAASVRAPREEKFQSLTPTHKKRKNQPGGFREKKEKPSQAGPTATKEEISLYASAKRAFDAGDLEQAELLYQNVIRRGGSRLESAIKDLAMVFIRLRQADKAVELLENHRPKARNQETWNNSLISAYQGAMMYDKMIPLLNVILQQTEDAEQKLTVRWQIANAYLKSENYSRAVEQFRKVLKIRPESVPAQKRLALCHAKKGEYKDAENILNTLQDERPDIDPEISEWLTAIKAARTTGTLQLDDDNIHGTEMELSYFSGELDKFARFSLDGCRLMESVQPGRVNEVGKYVGSEDDAKHDIGRQESMGKQHRTKNPLARSNCYLVAARICFDMENYDYRLYQYLCRSFASRGDAAVGTNLDVGRSWYCQALSAYDRARGILKARNPNARVYEQDAVNSIVRYLYSTLGNTTIPRDPEIPTAQIDEATKKVVEHMVTTGNTKKAFDAISYLLLHSQYALRMILRYLYDDTTLRARATDYLRDNGMVVPDNEANAEYFRQTWNELCQDKSRKIKRISSDLQTFSNFEFRTSWLEDKLKSVDLIIPQLFVELDQQHVAKLREILKAALRLCEQRAAEAEDELCGKLIGDCSDQLDEITKQPTTLSIEHVYPIIEVIQKKADEQREEIKENRKPVLELRLPEGKESYVSAEGSIDVQIVVQNEEGRMPADRVRLVTQPDDKLFTKAELLDESQSIRGGKQVILRLRLSLTDEAEMNKAFSLRVHAQYVISGDEDAQTDPVRLPIQLEDEEKEFEHIKNPYRIYATGRHVQDKDMFFGREKLLEDISDAVRMPENVCVLVYGQYRSGKTSFLDRLHNKLQENEQANEDLLVLYIENIQSALDSVSSKSYLHQILALVLQRLKRAIEAQQNGDLPPLKLTIPDTEKFLNHHAPRLFFEEVISDLKRELERVNRPNVRIVLLIDEFQYTYDLYVEKKLDKDFMQHWKDLLQRNHFSAVLVGQDVLSKFKKKFSNAFGTIEPHLVTYLDKKEASELIEDPIRIGGEGGESRYREKSVDRILDLTACSPFLIHKICDRLVDHMNVKRVPLVTEADVESVKRDLIDGVRALPEDDFHCFTDSGDPSEDAIKESEARAVLKAIADNTSDLEQKGCRKNLIESVAGSNLDDILEDLERRQVVKRTRDLDEDWFRIRSELFKEWLVIRG